MRTRWWSRVAAAVLGLVVAVGLATPAQAHTVGGVGPTNFQTTLSALTPQVSGVTLRVIENGSQLELRNDTATDVVVQGYGGEPYARVGPEGVSLNDNSPATFLNVDRYSTSTVPATADGKGPPVWRKVAGAPVWRWHDHRVHWMLSTLPPAVAADPGAPHEISAWTVVLDYRSQQLTATGTLSWVPGPSPWPWFLLAFLVAVAVAGLASLARPHRWLAGTVAVLSAVSLLHGLGAMLVVAGSVPERMSALLGADAVLIWPVTGLTAALLWRRHTRAAWLAAGLGLLIGVEAMLDDAPIWWRSSAPSALASIVDRLTISLVVGLGAGLVLVLPLLLRRHRPQAPPVRTAGTPTQSVPARVAQEPAGPVQPAVAPVPAHQSTVDGPVSAVDADQPVGIGRRQVAGLLAAGAVGALVGATAAASVGSGRGDAATTLEPVLGDVGARTIPFRGEHQAGIAAPIRAQAHGWVAALDLLDSTGREELRGLLRRWTEAAERLTAGEPADQPDDAVVAGSGPAALTVTVGFGPSFFGRAGIPASARPPGLAPLPAFVGDALDRAQSDGDLGLVVAADDPIVVAHAARVLTRLAAGLARLRWQQSGFNAARGSSTGGATGRNLMGQLDGTNNPQPSDVDFGAKVFVGSEAPQWLRGGSYLVVRRIRMLLDDWDGLPVARREQAVGRRLDSGAPLSGGAERTPADLGARAADGSLVVDAKAHIRLAAPSSNGGAAMLRRGFSYVDGSSSGLLFLAWQADPRRGFIPVQQRLAGTDLLHRFLRHESSALFAMPGGLSPGAQLGQELLESL